MVEIADRIKAQPLLRKGELIALIAVMLLCVVLVIIAVSGGSGEYAEVYIDGELQYRYSLAVDGEYEIDNCGVLVIQNGSVKMCNSTCPDHLCEQRGFVSAEGGRIICVPNGMVIVIGNDDVDAVV